MRTSNDLCSASPGGREDVELGEACLPEPHHRVSPVTNMTDAVGILPSAERYSSGVSFFALASAKNDTQEHRKEQSDHRRLKPLSEDHRVSRVTKNSQL